jgi:peptide/nickel transport system substrate-binding protein
MARRFFHQIGVQEMQRRQFLSLSAALAAMAVAGLPRRSDAAGTDVLKVATQTEYLPLNPESARSRFFTSAEISETLVWLDYDMVLQPCLATGWERVSPQTWRFALREGVTFHDGSALNAAAVKNSLEKITALMPYARSLLQIREIRTPDDHTIEIETLAPFASLPNQLTDAVTVIHAPSAFDGAGKFVQPVGTGPWKYVEYRPQDRTVLERFDGYRGAAPAFARIEYAVIPDDNARVIALETGEMDILMDFPRGDAGRLSGSKDISVVHAPISGINYGAFNCAEGRVLNDVRIRRAINLLVDRKLVVDGALDGFGRPAWQFFAPGYSWLPETPEPYSYDPVAAAALLEEAGYKKVDGKWQKDGKPLVLNVQAYHNGTGNGYIAEVMAALLNREGVGTEVNIGTYDGMVEFAKRGDYDVAVQYWTPELTADPDLHLTSQFKGDAGMNWQAWKNPRFDELVDRGRQLERGAEWNETYAEVLKILQEDAPIIPLVHAIYLNALRADLKGYRIHPTRFFFNLKEVSRA